MSFLGIFRDYRDLLIRAGNLQDRVDWLTDDNLRLSARNADLVEKLCAAKDSEITATQKMTDALARRYGGPVFDLSSQFPVKPEAFEPIPRQRQQASSVIEEMERNFDAEMEQMKARAMARPV